ncbi:MAG: D-alanyl-D-alanine carboxypeptidase [Lachnospiraceae bacterium]|nr:D-alanyl-D-alanine carboxypeptidase [Lachnospiraceae bacterium]
MENRLENENEEELRRARAALRRAQLRKQKARQQWIRTHIRMFVMGGGILIAAVILVLLVHALRQNAGADAAGTQTHSDGALLGNEGTAVSEVTSRSGGDASGATEYAGEEAAGADRTKASVDAAREVSKRADIDEEGAGGLSGSGDGETEGAGGLSGSDEGETDGADAAVMTANGMIKVGEVQFVTGYQAQSTAETIRVPEDENMQSTHAILIDESSGTIVAQKDAKTIISPASMTKILTVLVAAEHLDSMQQLDEKVTITIEMTDYAYRHDCSAVGFDVDERVPVRDLFYGTILPSGGDAAIALATYIAGSEEKFVEMMNEKLQELGLSDTAHFTNCVGLYDEKHYCSTYDMAMILKAAVENDFCREVLSAHTYNTALTTQHPEGILISNWFLRRIEDKDSGGEVLCAKTGFVNQSGSCAASYEISDSGVPYICVTADAHSSWRCIYDHVTMYSRYAK